MSYRLLQCWCILDSSFLLVLVFFGRKPKVVEVATDLQNVFTPSNFFNGLGRGSSCLRRKLFVSYSDDVCLILLSYLYCDLLRARTSISASCVEKCAECEN